MRVVEELSTPKLIDGDVIARSTWQRFRFRGTQLFTTTFTFALRAKHNVFSRALPRRQTR